MPTSLEYCYSRLESLVGNEMELEPFSVIRRVADHRAYWRPTKTRVVLLAESHASINHI